jgi:phage/plasmid-like protein (TIGR03299 family)
LDYEVGKTTIHAAIAGAPATEDSPEHLVKIEDKFATYRVDNKVALGIVGGRYEIVQNRDAFGFFDAIIDSGEAIFETAGALGKGERIFVTAKLPEDMLVGGEECNKYIILTNSHDGTSSIIAGFTSVRIVCNNTLQAALKGLTNKVLIEHRTGAKERLAEAYKVMNIGSKYMDEVSEIFNRMAKTPITDENLQNYITQVMQPEYKALKSEEENEKISTRFINQVSSIYDFALSHPTQQTNATRGTVWGAYNSISGNYNYIQKYKNEEQKFTSQMFGNANTKITKGFQKALELI